jgi:hypothetical protein
MVRCGTDPATDYGDPTSLDIQSSNNGIFLEVLSPVSSLSSSPVLNVEIRATSESDASEQFDVRIGRADGIAVQARPIPSEPNRYDARIGLIHGDNDIVVSVFSQDGELVRDARFTVRYFGTQPGLSVLQVSRPTDGACTDAPALRVPIINTPSVCVRGRATTRDGEPVQSLRVDNGELGVDVDVDADGSFAAAVPLVRDQWNALSLRATASGGPQTIAILDIRQDSTAPTLTIDDPAGDTVETDLERLLMIGQAGDDLQLDALELRTGQGGVTFIAPGADWSTEVRLQPGTNQVSVVATDVAGNQTVVERTVERRRIIRLRAPDESRSNVITVALSQATLEALISEEDRESITLTELALRGTIRQTVRRLADPEAFAVDTSEWGPSEFAFQRLLSTTPDSADLTGTSLEPLLELSESIGLPAPRMVAQLLNMDVLDPVLTEDVLTDTIVDLLVATHPNVTFLDDGEPAVRVSMQDAFTGLQDLGERFGPTGDHPGFISGTTSARFLEPGFRLEVAATSNLLERQGVDASQEAKAFLYLSTDELPAELDFTSDDTFAVYGLVQSPEVDLGIAVQELPTFIDAGSTRDARPDGTAFRGSSTLWDAPTWTVEHIVAEAAYRQFVDVYAPGFTRTLRYNIGAVTDAAVIEWQRGWITINTSGNLGNPPPPVYVWDFLTEVAQVRLHDDNRAEGDANVSFTLSNVPIGLSAEELIEALRPSLQAQRERLVEILIGDSGLAASSADFFLVATATGSSPALWYATAADRGDDEERPLPGFFADAELSNRLSTTAADATWNDTDHHKLPLTVGATAYFTDDTAATYRLQVLALTADSADVTVTRVSPEAP